MLTKPYKTITQDNGTVRIYGNNHSRLFEYFYELSDKDKNELDWIDDDTAIVFHYKGNVYALDEFERVESYHPNWLKEFHGIHNDSFFSGILIKFDPDDSDYYKVYTFIS